MKMRAAGEGKTSGLPGDSTTPVPTPLSGAVSSDAGAAHTVALTPQRTVETIGANSKGQLGDGTTNDSNTPRPVAGLNNVSSVGAGYEHTVAMDSSGQVTAWGDNFFGQLGDGGTLPGSSVPVAVPLPGTAEKLFVALWDHNFALMADGRLFGWGANGSGQLGVGDTDPAPSPVEVPVPSPVDSVAGGANHSLFLHQDGTVSATGLNYLGQLGTGNTDSATLPVPIPGLTDVAQVAAGFEHSLAVLDNGTVLSWGNNGSGQLGVGAGVGFSTSPLPVPGLTGILAIFAGPSHNVAIRYDGTVYTWGDNSMGQLGIGSNVTEYTPQMVNLSERVTWAATGFGSTLFHATNHAAGLLEVALQNVPPTAAALAPIGFELFEPGGSTPITSGEAQAFEGHLVQPTPPIEPYDVRLIPGGTHLSRRVLFNPSPSGDVNLGVLTFYNGDVDGNNTIGISDFLAIRSAFGTVPGNPAWNANADLNRDATVNIQDFVIFRSNFGRSGE